MPIFDPNCITYSQMNLIFNARIYYRRLTTWTRAYLMSRYLGIGTTEAQFERLYLESLAIGNMLQLIFGRRNSEEYSLLLSKYAIIFHQLITAQLEGDEAGVNENLERLYQNVEERALFLETINPYWNVIKYKELFNSYIRYTLETANAITAGDSAREMELYELLNALTNEMGDTFAQGIYAYIVSGGAPQDSEIYSYRNIKPCITLDEMNDIYTIMMLWFELVIWVRNYMIRSYTSSGNPEAALEKLMDISLEYVTTLKKFFPDLEAGAYLQLFYDYISLIVDFISAMIENDVEELNRITVELYKNADQRAAFLSSVNPLWDEENLKNILYTNLHSTIEESNSFLTKDYEQNIDIFTRLLDQSENTSRLLSDVIFEHISKR